MLLKRLEIRNVRKIKQADIDFHGPGLQVIQGKNKSGKSTLAQSIALTLEGTKALNPGIITHGEEQAEIIAFTDDGLQIKTVIKDSVKQTVSRLDDTSGRYVGLSGGVREFLNSIRSGLEMPWALRGKTDAQIIEVLKNRAGIPCLADKGWCKGARVYPQI
ncbi:MAG: AAA family ATPase [Treponema sp.]|jgi:DNA repair ATPase RecN|nr:AAA family ATPase [Treponema sp.]